MAAPAALRVLVVCDQPNLIDDYRRMFGIRPPGEGCGDPLAELESDLFGPPAHGRFPVVDLTVAGHGFEAGRSVQEAIEAASPFALAFVDLDGAPGGGLATAQQIRARDPDLHLVLSAARCPLHPVELCDRVPPADQLLFLAKPVSPVAVQQLVLATGARWRSERRSVALTAGAALPAMLDCLPVATMIFNRRDRLMCANRSMVGLFPELADLLVPGTAYAEIQRAIALRLLPDEALLNLDAWLRERLAWHAGGGGMVELRLRGARWILTVECPAKSGESLCLYHDITELKRLEAGRALAAQLADSAHGLSVLGDHLQALMRDSRPRSRPPRPAGGADRGWARRRIEVFDWKLQMAGQRRTLEPTIVDLNRFCAGLARRLRRSLPSGIEVELVAGVGLWPVVLDEEGLTAAVTELVHNACEAMPAGGRLTIETQNARLGGDYAVMRPGLQTGEYVRITVRDTGPGLSAEETQRALRPFRSSKDRTRHFGLGLNVAYGFARQSGGSMAIDAGEGRGARVALYFPRGEARWSEADRVEPALTGPVAKRLAAGR